MTALQVGGMRLVTADDVCAAVEAVLLEHLPVLQVAADLKPVTTWQQLPTTDALTAATVPAGAITSPGLAAPPVKHNRRYKATWRIATAVYDRGSDHRDVARRVRTWAALVRTVLVQHGRLGGLAETTTWVGEDYALLPGAGSARTLGGCSVSFDVVVPDVVPLAPPPELGGPAAAPIVRDTQTTVTVRPLTSQE